MSVVVDSYKIRESHRGNIQMCHECLFVAVWEIRQMLQSNPLVGYACGVHVDKVLFLVETGQVNDPEGI